MESPDNCSVEGSPLKKCFNNRQDFLPLIGARVTRKPMRGLLLYSMANILAFPDKGFLLNYGDGFSRLATRRKPKLHYTVTPFDGKEGQACQSPLRGVGGLTCFSGPLPSVSHSLVNV